MNVSVIFDWKSFGVLGWTAVSIILVSKIDAKSALHKINN